MMQQESPPHCQYCDLEPCVFKQFMEQVLSDIEIWEMGVGEQHSIRNSQKRKRCYRIFSQYINGHLGKGVQVELPSCVVENVRESFPNEHVDEKYLGFKEN